MDFFSSDPDRPGIIAVGQEAQGIFALGQLALGVVAVGQLARGVFALGQGAVGLFAVGQGAIGLFWAAGMIGIGGRGFGIVLKLLPKVIIVRPNRPDVGPVVPLEQIGPGLPSAYVEVSARRGLFELPAGLEPTQEVADHLREAAKVGHDRALLLVRHERVAAATSQQDYRSATPFVQRRSAERADTWEEHSPRAVFESPFRGVFGLLVRSVGFIGLAVLWWFLAGADVVGMFR